MPFKKEYKQIVEHKNHGKKYRHKVWNYGNVCIKCDTIENLTKHHIIKRGKNTGIIIVLCKSCHNKEHGCEPKPKAKCPKCGNRKICNIKGGNWRCKECGFIHVLREVFL